MCHHIWLYMYTHMGPCIYMPYTRVCAACVCVSVFLHAVFSLALRVTALRQSLSLNSKFVFSARLSGHLSSLELPVSIPSVGVTSTWSHAILFMWALGI